MCTSFTTLHRRLIKYKYAHHWLSLSGHVMEPQSNGGDIQQATLNQLASIQSTVHRFKLFACCGAHQNSALPLNGTFGLKPELTCVSSFSINHETTFRI